MELHTIGIDLGKTVFHMFGCDAQSRRGFTVTVAARGILIVSGTACTARKNLT